MDKLVLLLEQIVSKYKNRDNTGYKYYNDDNYYLYWGEITSQLLEDNILVYDGRRDDAFERTLDRVSDGDIDLSIFLSVLIEELKYYNDSIILIVPLNGLDKSHIADRVCFSDKDLLLFSVNESRRRVEKDKTLIGKYVEDELKMYLGMSHTRFKDPGFYNSPVLTCIFRDVNDNIINYHSQNIVQAIYAFIRMIEQNRIDNDDTWKKKINKFHASTYAVYYKSDYENKNPELNNGYGYQFKFFNSPILDVDTRYFLQHKQKFEEMFTNYIQFLFTPASSVSNKVRVASKRLISGIKMWNTAYELASIERFDSTLLLLVTILESLLLKNKGVRKKDRLAEQVSKFLNINCFEFIERVYSYRNKLMHEGDSVGTINNFRLVEQGHNYLPGYKPFEQYSFWGYPKKIEDIKELLNLTKNVIEKVLETNVPIIGENLES